MPYRWYSNYSNDCQYGTGNSDLSYYMYMKLPESSLIHFACIGVAPMLSISTLWDMKVLFEGVLHCCEKFEVPYLCNMCCVGVAWVREFDSIDRCCLSLSHLLSCGTAKCKKHWLLYKNLHWSSRFFGHMSWEQIIFQMHLPICCKASQMNSLEKKQKFGVVGCCNHD